MVTNNMPEKKLLRRADVKEWLGVTDWDIIQWVDAKVITRIRPNPAGYSFYDRDEIARKVLNGGR